MEFYLKCFVISHTGSITVVVIGGGYYFGGPNFIHKKNKWLRAHYMYRIDSIGNVVKNSFFYF